MKDRALTRFAYGLLALLVIGLGISIYLTITHYTDVVTLACPDTGVINCAKVTSSSYAYFFGIPMAVLGLVFFVGMIPLYLPIAWRSSNFYLRGARVVGSSIGMILVFWLVYVELFRVNSICLYCTGVHVITFLIFTGTLIGTALTA